MRRRGAGRACAGGLFAALIAASPLAAQPQQADPPPAAIGRISYGAHRPGDAICTGALVAPDLVLTAAHCVASMAGNPGTIRFAAAYANGTALAAAPGRAVILSQSPGLAGDVALVVLAAPLPATVVPLQTAPPASGLLRFAGYRRSDPETLGGSDFCLVLADVPQAIGLSCAVTSGNSGSPVLQGHGAQVRVVAVMVASGGAPVLSWAARLPEDIRAQIAGHR